MKATDGLAPIWCQGICNYPDDPWQSVSGWFYDGRPIVVKIHAGFFTSIVLNIMLLPHVSRYSYWSGTPKMKIAVAS